MNRRQLGSWYAVGVGVAIVGLWVVLLATGQVPELTTAPLEIGYHLVAELATALTLLAAGTGRHRRVAWADRLFPVALGMLLYTTVNSAGYYAGLAEWPVVGLFGVLTVATLVVLRWEVFDRPADRPGRPGRVTGSD